MSLPVRLDGASLEVMSISELMLMFKEAYKKLLLADFMRENSVESVKNQLAHRMTFDPYKKLQLDVKNLEDRILALVAKNEPTITDNQDEAASSMAVTMQ